VLSAILFSAVCGFSVAWSVTPAPVGETGSVTVTATLEEGDFVFVRENGRETASFELVSSLDEGGFTRAGGTVSMDQLPLERQLELRGIEPGTHRLLVVMRDLESGRRRTSEGTIEVPQLHADAWSSGALTISGTPGTGRVSGTTSATWQVFPPTSSEVSPESLEVAFLLRNDRGLAASEGWMTAGEGQDYSCDIPLSGLEPGEYQLMVAALLGNEVVAAAGASLPVRADWDVWGRDGGTTSTMVRPLATSAELDAIDNAGSAGERYAVMSEFWQDRDPNPLTPENEFLDTYLDRLDVIMDRFSVAGIIGITTDMGRVWALLGEPDVTEDMPFETGTYPYQVWTYFSPSLTVVFVDQDGFGLYEMTTPWIEVSRAYDR
jgi:GWxTD domain-containing protein